MPCHAATTGTVPVVAFVWFDALGVVGSRVFVATHHWCVVHWCVVHWCVPGMGVISRVEVPNGEGSSSRSLRQGCPW
ncbi:MAG: hypothetical protein KGZ50_11960 [Peptococcaceae bacterium]|nr:hypothetical protein [Peptococcaceae bacterium]